MINVHVKILALYVGIRVNKKIDLFTLQLYKTQARIVRIIFWSCLYDFSEWKVVVCRWWGCAEAAPVMDIAAEDAAAVLVAVGSVRGSHCGLSRTGSRTAGSGIGSIWQFIYEPNCDPWYCVAVMLISQEQLKKFKGKYNISYCASPFN